MNQAYSMVFINIFLSFLFVAGLLIHRFIFKRRINLFVLLILISILPIWSVFRSGTYESGDLTLHTNYLQSFFENLKDGIITPKWAGGLCGGFGCPLFMFEYVMPSYISSLFHFLGFSYLTSMKLFIATAYVLSGITMFIFLKEHTGEKGAFIGSLLFLFAPIRFIEMHFRVSVGTDASFIFIPLVFLFAKKSLEGKSIYIVLGAINFLFLILSHSSVTFIIVIASFLYAFIITKKFKNLLYLFLSFILGLGLSAYYILPALSEIKHTHYIFVQKVAEFHPLLDHIISPARFGLLFQGNHGDLRLIVGYLQLLILFFGIFYLFKNRLEKENKKIAIFLIIFSAVCFTLLLSFTKPLWNSIFFLRTFILPWRMLVPISFAIGFLGAIVGDKWKQRWIVIFSIATVGITILNWGNRKMVPFPPDAYVKENMLYTEYVDSPSNPFQINRFQMIYDAVNKDPYYVLKKHTEPIKFLSGDGDIKMLSRTQTEHEYLLNVNTDSVLSENTFYFPGWHVYVNGNEQRINLSDKRSLGTLVFSVPKGTYLLKAKFQDTPIVGVGKIISAVSFAIILFFALRRTPKLKVNI